MSPRPDPYAGSRISAFAGMTITLSGNLPDGDVLFVNRALVIGTGPIDDREWARREALRIVRTGLADVLAWLGEKPWQPRRTGREILESLR